MKTEKIYLSNDNSLYLSKKKDLSLNSYLEVFESKQKSLQLNSKRGLVLTNTLEWILPIKYSCIEARYLPDEKIDVLNCIEDDTHKCGIVTSTQKELLPFIYDDITFLEPEEKKSGRFVAVTTNLFKKAKTGVYDLLKGKLIIPIEYDYIKLYYLNPFHSQRNPYIFFNVGKKQKNKSKKYILKHEFFDQDGQQNFKTEL